MGWVPSYYSTRGWYKVRAKVLKRDKYTCQYCGDRAGTADHIIPRSKGGPNTMANLVACCMVCNEIAGGREFTDFEAKKTYVQRVRKHSPPIYGQKKGAKPKPRPKKS